MERRFGRLLTELTGFDAESIALSIKIWGYTSQQCGNITNFIIIPA